MKGVNYFRRKLKVVLMLLIAMQMHFQNAYSQENSCGFNDTGPQALIVNGYQGLKLFDETLGCNPLTLKCNFVIIRRDDGTGNMDPTSPFWGEWEQQMNNELTNITDVDMCSTGYPLDAKIRVDFEVHTIDNTAAWDWYAEANADNYPSTSHPNGPYICPRFDNSWSALEDAMTAFEQSHFGEINFFFTDNGELVDLLENHIANGTEPTEPYEDRFEAAGNGLASGCSIYPKSYFSQASENSYVIAHTYSDYLIRQNFHHIWWPQYANESPATVWSWSYLGKRLLFLHEMGHNVLRMGHNSSCRQLMTSSWSQRTNHITKLKLERLHRVLASTDLHNAVDCNSLGDVCPVQVVADETLDKPISVFGDLIIKKGVTFTVTSDIYFSEESRVIVEENAKLIVDGGLLTNGCGLTWKGIKVYGGNTDFDVKFTNGAIIENTSKAAVSMFAPEPWPQITNWGNGILQAENSTFNNTKRIVEFMSWSPLPNPSYIRDCVHNGGKWSIANWNCQGIDVRDNVFNDITNECIVTETGQFTIVGNEFNSGQSDILFNNVSAGISTLVDSNQFNGSNTGYNARGTTFAQNRIWNNNFQTGFVDVMNDGHNQYDLGSNNITSTFGAATFDGGGGIADVHNNDFSGNLAGGLPIGSNEDYNFYENCYSTSFVDNHIVGQISPVIHGGSAFSPTHNCFTHNGNLNSSIQDLGGNPDPFTYLEATDEPVDCENAILADPLVNRISNGDKNDPECGSSLGGGFTEWNYCWPKRWVKDDVLFAYSWLRNKLNEIDNNPNLSDEQKKWFKQIYKRCFWRVRGYLFEVYVKESNYTDARALFQDESHEDAKVYIYSSYILENDLIAARTYLNSISSESEQMQDFITIQNINLDRLPYGPFYEAASNEIGTVRAIALKSHPYAAYGKALYYVLTGEVISSTIPDLGRDEIQPRSISSSNQMESLKLYPNPFSDVLYIEISGYEYVNISVSDFFGRTIFTDTSEQTSLSIPTETWNQGMYIVTIKSEGEIVLTDKILLVH
jgi:hypothetical protein